MNRALFVKELRASLGIAGIFAAVLVMYIGMVVSMFDPKLGENLNEMMASMPQAFAAFGMSTRTTTLTGFMLNYLYGFLLVVLPFVLIMILVGRLMVRHLERGTMAYLLATPNSRTSIALTMAGVLMVTLAALMVAVIALELGFAESLFPGKLDAAGLVRASAGLFALWAFLGGTCFASACAIPGAARSRWVGGGLCIAFLLMQMVSQVGERFEFLKKVNPLTLFDCYGLAAGDASAIGRSAALGAVGIALLAVAVAVFDRRDLAL